MSSIINPKPCNYGCDTRIYWDISSNSFLEVFTKQKHICKNRNNNNASYSKTNVLKPNYYNRFVVVCGNNFLISLCILRKCNPFSVILNVLVPSRYFIRLVSVNVERYSFYWL